MFVSLNIHGPDLQPEFGIEMVVPLQTLRDHAKFFSVYLESGYSRLIAEYNDRHP